MNLTALKERPVSYKIQPDGTFTVENYTAARPFSNFLPAVAGPFGIPLWAFYVNRGQCVASFGVSDKDRAIMQFVPANLAYAETPFRGFRTFVKILSKREFEFYEPFQNHLYGTRYEIHQSLHIRPWGFSIEDRNASLGLEVQVEYFGVPQEPFAALARRLVVRNVSAAPLELEILDGLPSIVPFGLNDFFLKNMSRTVEAWMVAQRPAPDGPVLYRVRSDPYDRPEYRKIEGANFYQSFAVDPRGKTLAPEILTDPDAVFGSNLDFSDPRAFLASAPYAAPRAQATEGRTACAFSFVRASLGPNQTVAVTSYVGQADHPERYPKHFAGLLNDAAYARKRDEIRKLIGTVQLPATSASASREYDQYCAQTYLDNALRGGWPWALATEAGDQVFHLYSRRHGDLERDYNSFVVHPTYLSQGEGNYRDVNQNRRTDVAFEPRVRDANVKTFFNLLQLDGFNPLLVKESRLRFRPSRKLREKLRAFIPAAHLDRVAAFMAQEHTPGEVLQFIEEASVPLNGTNQALLGAVLPFSERHDAADHGQGFWIDHWFYNLDLLENYLAVYPEELENILLKDRSFTFYDNPMVVKPRSEKIVRLADGRIRQLGAVVLDAEKDRLIRSRPEDPNTVRTRHGRGKIYRTTLAAKIVCLAANKFASLDPEGAGLEMEADRPDWLDSLNGLPALFGSSFSGTLELVRLVDFLEEAFRKIDPPPSARLALPAEVAALLAKLKRAAERYLASSGRNRSYDFWNATHDAKEEYWKAVRLGVKGAEVRMPVRKLRAVLKLFAEKLREGAARAWDPAKSICPTYFTHEVAEYRAVKTRARQNGAAREREVIFPKRFRQRALPPFLEGSVHALRVEKDPRRAEMIYNAVRSSELFDRRLGMYRVSASLAGESPEIGRIRAFTPGWLENQSVFLHMEYKFLLELLKKGLADAFFADLRTALVAFQDPKVYGRSIFENSSFIVSSAHADKKLHGSGFVARLSGSTAEFLEMWLVMNVGREPFFVDENGKLALRLAPSLPPWLFTEHDAQREITLKNGSKLSVFLPKNSYAFLFLGQTVVTYHNPKRLPTSGPKRAVVKRITFQNAKGQTVMESGNVLPAPYAREVREGRIARLDAELG
jgi:hypothetical protein